MWLVPKRKCGCGKWPGCGNFHPLASAGIRPTLPPERVGPWHLTCNGVLRTLIGFGGICSMCCEKTEVRTPSQALVVEEDPLTAWAVGKCLDSSYVVQRACNLEEAAPYLENFDVRVLICGSPVVESDLGVLGRLAQDQNRTVIALVSDTTRLMPDNVIVVEKPFALADLAGLLQVRGQAGRPIEEITEEDWRTVFQANVDGAFWLTQAVAPVMKQAGFGRVVNIASGAGLRPSLTGIQAYTTAKHALVGLTKQLSWELGPHGITVNAIAPGFILSNPTTIRQWENFGPEGQKQLLEAIHTKRLGAPEDIANATLFLADESSGWISGQILSVDGGRS